MENSRKDDVIVAALRLKGETIVPWEFTINDPDRRTTGLGTGPVKKLGEAIKIVAEGTLDFEGDEMPISIHMTVPIASAAMPVFGDPMLVHISRMYK